MHVYPVKPRPLQTSERHKTKQNKTLKSGKCNNQNCSHVKKNCVSIVQREVKLDTFKNPFRVFKSIELHLPLITQTIVVIL